MRTKRNKRHFWRPPDAPITGAWLEMDANQTNPEIYLSENPSRIDLEIFWAKLRSDPTVKGAYMDTMPHSLDTFLAPISEGAMRLWLIYANHLISGAHWAHDIQPIGDTLTAWFGSYYFPEIRGRLAAHAFPLFVEAAREYGITHIFGGHRITNRAARGMGKHMGLHHVGDIERFGWFEGQLDTLCVYTVHPDGADEAMRQAIKRAEFYRSSPPHQ